MLKPIALALFSTCALSCCMNGQARKSTPTPTPPTTTMTIPPATLRHDAIADTYHGQSIPDPFRWLEEPDAPDTRAFIDAQNARTRALLDIPLRTELRARLQQLVNYPRTSAPGIHPGYYTVSKNSGLQPQSVLYTMTSLSDPAPKVLFDPNGLSPDGTRALSHMAITHDGKLFSYGISEGGSDNQTIHVRNIATGADLPDVLSDMRFASVAWKHDNTGFFYSKYPSQAERLNQTVYYHALGSDPAKSPVVYARPDNPEISVDAGITEDGQYLILSEGIGTDPRGGMLIVPVDLSTPPVRILEPLKHDMALVGNDGPTFFAITDESAPRKKLVSFDLANPARTTTLIPEAKGVLTSAEFVGDTLVVSYLEDARTRLFLYTKQGRLLREIELPTVGSAYVSARRDHPGEFFVSFTSYTYPTSVFRYDTAANTMSLWNRPAVDFDPDAYETHLDFATSKDGTKVPLFVTHKKGLKLDGRNPTLLYAYGGFNISLTPYFSSTNIPFLERGGVHVVACLRGGGEYGTAWHEAGMLGRKQNVFDDFHASAQHLIDRHYTSSKSLAIEGGSNGGLLVSACMLQRPELYGAVLCHVPVTDMLRYHRFGTGRFWTPEYGNADGSETDFRNLLTYSPLHNVKPKAVYPAILLTTGDGDDRVVPAHALKLTAALLAAAPQTTTPPPVYLRYETKAGHGAGKPLQKQLDEKADCLAFLFHFLQR